VPPFDGIEESLDLAAVGDRTAQQLGRAEFPQLLERSRGLVTGMEIVHDHVRALGHECPADLLAETSDPTGHEDDASLEFSLQRSTPWPAATT
jgi:hypothetical protein